MAEFAGFLGRAEIIRLYGELTVIKGQGNELFDIVSFTPETGGDETVAD